MKFTCFAPSVISYHNANKHTANSIWYFVSGNTCSTHRFTPQHKLPYIFVLSFVEIKQFPEDNPSNEMSFLTVLSPLGPFHSSL